MNRLHLLVIALSWEVSRLDIAQPSNQPHQVHSIHWHVFLHVCHCSTFNLRNMVRKKDHLLPKDHRRPNVWQHSIHHDQFQDFRGILRHLNKKIPKPTNEYKWWPLNQPSHPMVAINPSAITCLLPQAGAVTCSHCYRKGRRCHGLTEPRIHLWPRRLLAEVCGQCISLSAFIHAYWYVQ